MSKVLVVGKGRQCYKYSSYAAESRPGDLQEFFDSTEGIVLKFEATNFFFTAFIIIFRKIPHYRSQKLG